MNVHACLSVRGVVERPAPLVATHRLWTIHPSLSYLRVLGVTWIRQRLGERVRRLRRAKGLSQEAFAERCELHRTYVGAIERGERNVAIDNLVRIAAALGLRLSELLDIPAAPGEAGAPDRPRRHPKR
jgi:DNA-binding XRE family transcriptional regulator